MRRISSGIRWVALAALLGCGDADPTEQPPVGVTPTPALAALLPNWAPVIPVTVGKLGQANMLLDTGADILRLSPAWASKVGKKTIDSITLGSKTLANVSYASYDTATASGLLGVTLDGIAGNLLFADLVVTLDYAKKTVYPLASWRDDYTFGDHVVGPVRAIPFKLAGITRAILLSGRFESMDHDVNVILDSGTSSAVISQGLFNTLGIEKQGRTVLRGSKAISSLGNVDSPIVRIRSFALGGDVAANNIWATVLPDLLFSALALQVGAKVDAIIGGAYLREFLVAMDYPKKTLRLRRYKDLSHIGPEFQMVGIEPINKNNKFQVFTVFKKSDAEAKGVAEGDAIQKVGGQSTASMSLDQLNTHLRGTPGTTLSMTLHNTTKGSYTVTVQRQDLLPALK